MASDPDLDEEITVAANDSIAERSSPVNDSTPKPSFSASTFDISAFSAAGSNLQTKIGGFAENFEGLKRGWDALDAQLTASQDEIVRLNAIEMDRGRLANELDDQKSVTARLEKDLAASRAEAATASERATKFEEICESIKERAFELHTALQEVKTNEEKYIADLDTAKEQLAEAGRKAQDQGVALTAAEERNKKADERNTLLETTVKGLEADNTAARERISKLVEDNKTITSQVPALLVDRERLQKQFSASERENSRLVAERQTLSDRVRGLEDEIRTLRSDLGSLSSSNGARTPVQPAEPVEDDLDLEASLERVFSAEMSNASDKDAKH